MKFSFTTKAASKELQKKNQGGCTVGAHSDWEEKSQVSPLLFNVVCDEGQIMGY